MQSRLAEAKKLAETLVKQYKPEKIILFGSAARGDYHADSDIDLLIIKQSRKKKVYRIKEIFEFLRTVPRIYPLDPIVYTPDEIKERLSLGDYFIKRIMTEGEILYG
jgi:predicted nucleotidyltransferase